MAARLTLASPALPTLATVVGSALALSAGTATSFALGVATHSIHYRLSRARAFVERRVNGGVSVDSDLFQLPVAMMDDNPG